MKCPICHETFESDRLMELHLEFHKSQSSLSQTDGIITRHVQNEGVKPPNTRKIFGQTRFEILVSEKNQNITNIEELVYRRNFIEQIKIVVPRNPFLFAPYFIDDLFEGMSSTDLCKRHSVATTMDLQNIVQKVLQLEGRRYRKNQYVNAYEMNLKISTWKTKYQIFKDNCDYFQDELLQLLFYNLISSYIVIMMMDHTNTGLTREDIIINSKDLSNNLILFEIIDPSLKKKLDYYFINCFTDIVNEVIAELIEENILHKKYGDATMLVGILSIDKIKDEIINELKFNPDIQSEVQIKRNIVTKYQSIRLLPGINIWNTAISELEYEKMIRREYGSRSKQSPLVFLEDNRGYA